jgi:hypothetical protein
MDVTIPGQNSVALTASDFIGRPNKRLSGWIGMNLLPESAMIELWYFHKAFFRKLP